MKPRQHWLLLLVVVLSATLVCSESHAYGNDRNDGNEFGKDENHHGRDDIPTTASPEEVTTDDEVSDEFDVVDDTDVVDETVEGFENEEVSEDDEFEDEEGTPNRTKRATITQPAVSASAKRLVGKTVNLSNLTKLTKNVKLTFSGKPINLAQFKVDASNVAKVDSLLRGETLENQMYVVAKLAGIEQTLAGAQKKKLTVLSIEDLIDDDIVLDREDVDELEAELKNNPSLLNFNSPAPVVDKVVNETITPATPTPVTGGGQIVKERVKRKIVSRNSAKWPTTIRYVVTSDFNSYPSTRTVIHKAVQHWEQETCLNFIHTTSTSGDHMRFRRHSGCWSSVGRKGGGQTISIGPGCATKGIVAHEIGHALGFWHEQSRPDRSTYVNIHSSNIKWGRSYNFVRKSWSDVLSLGVPYDYSSVMHYGAYYFSKNGQKTISTKVADMDRTIGSRTELSFYDVKLANLRYCNGRCGGLTWYKCRNDGYRDPKNCAKCKCPDGWTGTYCTDLQSAVNANCGSRYLTATSSWQYLSSPNYASSGFPANTECSWRIRANGYYKRVVMQFVNTFKIHSYCPNTCKNYVEVRHQHLSRTGPRYCCSRPTKLFKSNGYPGSYSDLLLLMRITSGSGLRGFQIRYKTESCGGNGELYCSYTRSYRCYGVYYKKCGFWNWSRCKRYRLNTCYSEAKRCSTGHKLVGSRCYREWSNWSSWSSCSKSCGGCGVRTRTRTCLRAPCRGSSRQTVLCNKQVCPNTFKVSKSCRYTKKCGFWGWKRCTRYRVCYSTSRCCAGKRQQGNICV